MKTKQIVITLVLLFSSVICNAQYYNHDPETCSGVVSCGACYGTGVCYGYVCMSCGGSGAMQCPACAGYRAGKQYAEQQKRARWNNAYNCLNDGISYLMQESYGSAMKYFKRSAELGNPQANMYIGEMYEFGFGVEGSKTTAKKWYDRGANQGDVGCQNRLNRIRQYGYFEANSQNRRAYLQNLKNASNWAAVSAQQMTNKIWGNSSKSSSSSSRGSSKVTCSGCHGSGKCTGCAGRGEYRGDGYYGTTKYDCPVCKGTGRCQMCYGRGVLR